MWYPGPDVRMQTIVQSYQNALSHCFLLKGVLLLYGMHCKHVYVHVGYCMNERTDTPPMWRLLTHQTPQGNTPNLLLIFSLYCQPAPPNINLLVFGGKLGSGRQTEQECLSGRHM